MAGLLGGLLSGRPADGADRAIEVVLWDTATGKKVGEVPGRSGESATAMHISSAPLRDALAQFGG